LVAGWVWRAGGSRTGGCSDLASGQEAAALRAEYEAILQLVVCFQAFLRAALWDKS
jgi:hypothetical protein